jgi:hypothetical protein
MASKLVSEAVEANQCCTLHADGRISAKMKGPDGLIRELGDCAFYLQGILCEIGFPDVSSFFAKRESCATYSHNELIPRALIASANDVAEVIYRHVFYNEPLDIAKLEKSIEGYVDVQIDLCGLFEITLRDVLDSNIDKLLVRFGKLQFTNEAATARVDKQEIQPSAQP